MLRRWRRCCTLLIALALGCRIAVPASAATQWSSLADMVFHPVARSTDAVGDLPPTMLAQDGQGFIWGAGETGLLRWDGYQARSYAAAGAPDGLADHDIQSMHTDAAGRLWVGTVAGGLARYDPAHDRFVQVELDGYQGQGRTVWCIEGDGADGLWVATDDGLFRLDAAGVVREHLRHDPDQPASLPDEKAQAVLVDRQGGLWVGGRYRLWHRAASGAPFAAITLPVADPASVEVSHLLEDSAGRIWIGTRGHGAFVFDAGAPVRSVAVTTQLRPGAATNEIMAIQEVQPGTVWLGTFGKGIVAVDAATLQTRALRHDPLEPRALDSDTVLALQNDRSGSTWVSTTRGLSRVAAAAGVSTLFGSPGRPGKLSGSDVTALLARGDGTIWVGSQNDGIDILGPSGARNAVPDIQRVYSLVAGAADQVFAGTRTGLYKVDRDGRFSVVQIPGRVPTAGVYTLLMREGVLWLGGADDGLWELPIAADGTLAVARHLETPVLTNATVHSIKLGPDGLLAVGTEHGLNLVDPATGRVERIVPDPAVADSIGGGTVMAMVTDRRGRLWVGTESAGISILVRRDSLGRALFAHVGVADGLPSPTIDWLHADQAGRIWASTDGGLALIDPDTFAVRALRAADGVAIMPFWTDSGAMTADGDLVFGGIGGIVVVQPDRFVPWTYRPPVVVTEIRIGGRIVGSGVPDGPLIVPPHADSLAVEFAALDYTAPERNRYQYRLDGFDRDWVDADAAHRVAAYTNLPPGGYTLHLRGSNRDGVWSEPPLAIAVSVLPAWYQTTWFRLIEAGAVLLLGVALVQARTLILRRHQRELERQIEERTAELSASQQQLRQFAYFDTLTGLPNRRAFNAEFQAALDAPGQACFALVLVDLDGFKKVNDTMGHSSGDELLLEVAQRLREVVREGDMAARLGGDEFAVLLRGMDGERAAMVCQRIVSGMAKPMRIKGCVTRIGASAGVARFPEHGRTQDELFRRVDLALYAAKHAGRGTWRWYRDSLESAEATM